MMIMMMVTCNEDVVANFDAKSLYLRGGTEERRDRNGGRFYCARILTEYINLKLLTVYGHGRCFHVETRTKYKQS
jgi:hypothetical protein